MGRWVWAVGVCTALLLLAQVAPSATAAPPVCSPPEQGKCIPTPDECASGRYNGHWDRGGLGRQAECNGGGGRVVYYAGGDLNVPCGVVIEDDRTITGSRGIDPNMCFPAEPPRYAGEGRLYRPAVRGRGGVVAAQSPQAAEIGAAVLAGGGNAMDAAVATVFAVGVVRPELSGIGGGGFLVYRSAQGETAALDFRETAPAALTQENLSEGVGATGTGRKSVGVPGTVAGMAKALDRFGSISLAEAIAPAERLARRGFVVSAHLSDMYVVNDPPEIPLFTTADRLRLYPEAARIYLDGGRPPRTGSRLAVTDYADSLKLVAEQGPNAFYRGRIARLIGEEMERSRQGTNPGDEGILTEEDLASYEAKWRTPVKTSYRGHTVIAMPPPTAGGILTAEMLNVLEGFDLRSAGYLSADHLHLLAEAQKLAWADRIAHVGDPDFVPVPTEELTSKEYAARRRPEIDRQRAGSYQAGLGDSGAPTAAGAASAPSFTTHVSAIDVDGNAVSVTNSIGSLFGSTVVAPGTGFLLGNQIAGFQDSERRNNAQGGKRPRSDSNPVIVVKDGAPVLVIGGAGGVTIAMGVIMSISNVVDFGFDPGRAADAARIRAPRCCSLAIEDARVRPDALAELQRRGHSLARGGEYTFLPWVQAAGTDISTGELLAASDPRDEWGSAAVPGGAQAEGARCLARRAPIGRRNIGRVRLGYTRRRALRRIRPRPVRRTRRSYSWCVKRSTGRVTAVFGGKGRVQLVTTTAPAHGMRRVVPGARGRLLRRAFPRRRRVARGIYRAGPRSNRVFGFRSGRVRFVAVLTRQLLRRPRALRRHVRLAGIPVG